MLIAHRAARGRPRVVHVCSDDVAGARDGTEEDCRSFGNDRSSLCAVADRDPAARVASPREDAMRRLRGVGAAQGHPAMRVMTVHSLLQVRPAGGHDRGRDPLPHPLPEGSRDRAARSRKPPGRTCARRSPEVVRGGTSPPAAPMARARTRHGRQTHARPGIRSSFLTATRMTAVLRCVAEGQGQIRIAVQPHCIISLLDVRADSGSRMSWKQVTAAQQHRHEMLCAVLR
jgi:hypothetical protein